MQTVKEMAMDVIKQLPGDVTLEDIQYRLYVRGKIEKGLNEVREGKTLGAAEMNRKMKKWLAK